MAGGYDDGTTVSYSRLFRDIAEGYQIPLTEVGKLTMHQLWIVCIDKKKHLPSRTRKDARDTISFEDAVARGLVKPGEFSKQKGPSSADDKDQEWLDGMQQLAEQSLQMTPQMQGLMQMQHAKQQEEDAARKRKRDRKRQAKK